MPIRTSLNLIAFSIIVVSAACTKQTYRQALLDAARPTPAKVYDELTPITNSNKDLLFESIKDANGDAREFVLVASWKKAKDTVYYHNDKPGLDPSTQFYNTGSRPIFVTAIPDLQDWYQKELPKRNINKRLFQLLGLPPDTSNRLFILFWVKPEDLMRPCIDTEIDDATCDFTFDHVPAPADLIWLTDFIRQSYKDSLVFRQYPFTQLGYTYDWNRKNKTHVGLSEFVIRKNSLIKVAGFHPTESFVKASSKELKSMSMSGIQ